MKYSSCLPCLFVIAFGFFSCNDQAAVSSATQAADTTVPAAKGTYAYDLQFLQQHTKGLVELSNEDSSARILVSPEWQGRVMTSTAKGAAGLSFGWLNYELLSAPAKKSQFNPIGGEERFWLGPEGGQYSVYFKPGVKFDFQNWQVPAVLDTQAYRTQRAEKTSAVFQAEASLVNYTGTRFDIDINRTISLLGKSRLTELIRIPVP